METEEKEKEKDKRRREKREKKEEDNSDSYSSPIPSSFHGSELPAVGALAGLQGGNVQSGLRHQPPLIASMAVSGIQRDRHYSTSWTAIQWPVYW